MSYIKRPASIENRSFEIIEEEMDKDLLNSFTEEELLVVKRVVHSTADFDYANIIRFVDDPIEKAKEALLKGGSIYVDTNMIKAGINKRVCAKLGTKLINYVAEQDVIDEAARLKTTRSIVSIKKAIREDKPAIFVIGNAPTALFALMEEMEKGLIEPALVVAAPIGFVGAAESKDQYLELNKPTIAIKGRKGGSTVSVAIINSILYLLRERDGWNVTEK